MINNLSEEDRKKYLGFSKQQTKKQPFRTIQTRYAFVIKHVEKAS